MERLSERMRIPEPLRESARLIGRTPGRGIGLAFTLVAAATLINLWAWPQGSSEDGHYFSLIAAVLISGTYGGFTAGICATLLGVLSSSYFTLLPQFSIAVANPNEVQRLLVFFIEGVLLSLISPVLRSLRAPDISIPSAARYLILAASTGSSTALKFILPSIATELPFSAFNYAAIYICAWTGGLMSGLAATFLLTGLTRFFFLEPYYSLSVSGRGAVIRVAFFSAEGILLSILGDSHKRLRHLLERTSARARNYLAAAVTKEVQASALRSVSRDTVWEWEIEENKIHRTPSWQDTISAVLPEEETFGSWVDRIHPEDRSVTVSRLREAMEEGREELQYLYRLLVPGSKPLLVWDCAFIVRGADRKPVRIIGRSAELPSSKAVAPARTASIH